MHVRTFLASTLLWLVCATAWAQASATDCPIEPTPPSSRAEVAARMQSAKDRGFLWSIEKAGVTSYLFGTLHAGNPETMYLGPKTQQAFAASTVLAVEINLQDPSTIADIVPMMVSSTPTVVVSPQQSKELARLVAAACLPSALKQAMPRMHPNVQLIQLSTSDYVRSGYFAGYGSEAFLIGLATGSKRRVVALERARDQMALLLGHNSDEAQQGFNAALKLMQAGGEQRKAAKIAQVWAESDFAAFANFEQWCGCAESAEERQMLKALNDDRNPGLAAGIAKLHDSGERVFAAVGALHFFGARSVPNELEKLGFRVTRLHPSPQTRPDRP
jgi:uncharacterized protein